MSASLSKLLLKFSSAVSIVGLITSLFLTGVLPASAATSYYVDCSAPTNGTGTQTSPWNNLTTVSSRTFAPGDSLLFKRGTTCVGFFYFSSAGTSTARITIGAYGTGAQPIIDGNFTQATVELMNPDYVTMQDIEVINGRTWGILATTNKPGVSTGLILQNLTVRHVTGGVYQSQNRKWTGLVVIAPGVVNLPQLDSDGGLFWTWERLTHFDQVLIENVTAYDTTLWGGIFVWGMQLEGDTQWKKHALDRTRRSKNITIRNSLVHDTFGDGFAVYLTDNVLMENNVVYRSGMEPPNPSNPGGGTTGTPVALWYWSADSVTGQFNEAYDNHSPGVDGGAFDLDYYSTNGTYQYNYAHDNSAYCVGIFGAEGDFTVNSIFRYNICAGNGTQATLIDGSPKPGRGEIYPCTWKQGGLDGVQVYNNTLYVTATGAVDWCSGGTLKLGTKPLTFRNNLIVSTLQNPYGAGITVLPWIRDHNLWYYTLGTLAPDPSPEPNGKYNLNPLVNTLGYHGIGLPTTQWTLQLGSPAINAGMNPCTGVTGCTPGTRDFFGNVIPQGGAYDIGAHESSGTSPTATPAPPTNTPTRTNTPVPPTNTPIGPTNTPTRTNTPAPPTNTPTAGPTATPTRTNTPVPPTATPGGSVVMHVADILTTDVNGVPKTVFNGGDTIYWRAKIVDAGGAAVSGATVTTTLTRADGSLFGPYTATTDAAGWALFSQKSANAWPNGTSSVQVTNVTKIGATYDPAANVKTSASFTMQ